MSKGEILILAAGIVFIMLGIMLGIAVTRLVKLRREEQADLEEKDRHFQEVLATHRDLNTPPF